MVSVRRLRVRDLEAEVRDPAFQRLIDDGYRPLFTLPFVDEERGQRENDPYLYVVMARQIGSRQQTALIGIVAVLALLQAVTLMLLAFR